MAEFVLGENRKVDVQKLWLITYDSMNNHHQVLGGKVNQAICDGLTLK